MSMFLKCSCGKLQKMNNHSFSYDFSCFQKWLGQKVGIWNLDSWRNDTIQRRRSTKFYQLLEYQWTDKKSISVRECKQLLEDWEKVVMQNEKFHVVKAWDKVFEKETSLEKWLELEMERWYNALKHCVDNKCELMLD